MGKINKAESVVKNLVIKVRREDDDDRSRSVYPYRLRYRGVACIKGLRRVKLAEVISESYCVELVEPKDWNSPRVILVFDAKGGTLRYDSRKDCRDQIRRLRQGTREEVIRQAELVLKRIVAAYRI